MHEGRGAAHDHSVVALEVAALEKQRHIEHHQRFPPALLPRQPGVGLGPDHGMQNRLQPAQRRRAEFVVTTGLGKGHTLRQLARIVRLYRNGKGKRHA